MPSLLVTVFVLQLVIHLVNTVGAASVDGLLWNIFNRFPSSTAQAAASQRGLQKEFLRLRKELSAVSAQDEFAKWAKLDRQMNKVKDQLEKTKASLESTKATFDKIVLALRWIGTNGLRMFLQFWYQKQPMFWLPQGWVPYYAEWLLSFPRAPLGSVSIQAWGYACGAIILLVSDAIISTIGLLVASQSKPVPKTQSQPMKVAQTKENLGSRDSARTSKKEL